MSDLVNFRIITYLF